MELKIIKSGLLTTVQDLGRWGYQSKGVPVAGAMDSPAIRMGNVMLGNPQNAAALEVTLTGPEIEISGFGCVVFTGADLGFCVNGEKIGSWSAICVQNGDIINFKDLKDLKTLKEGCRGYICVKGGIDVPLVMGSRSTYIKAAIGGFKGRALKAGDLLQTGQDDSLWRYNGGFVLPLDLRPITSEQKFLKVISCSQEGAFTQAGLDTFYNAEYTISNESDRMGCRLEGPRIEHAGKADIVSSGIALGAVQVPAHGRPIIMLADRQTTGGYTNIGVLSALSVQALAQRVPGQKVKFARTSRQEAVEELIALEEMLERASQMRSSWVSRI